MQMNNVLFEIGVEELPARFIEDAKNQLQTKTEAFLKDARISYHSIHIYATPRRLALLIENIAERQSAHEEIARGPRLDIAQDENGDWTKAAIGFTRGNQASVEDIFTGEDKGITYIYVKKTLASQETQQLLPQFKDIIDNLSFPQTMRWGDLDYRFARPIRWITALYNDEVIPFTIANISSNRQTEGHRFLGKAIDIQDATTYVEQLREQFVIVKDKEREQIITEQLANIEKQQQFTILMDDDLLEEVNYLVEYPTAFVGSFDEKHLQLPKEVLITSMKEHQRYFPAANHEGRLLPYFIGVRNGDDNHLDNVIRGNEKVLKARLADAEFFYREDKSQSIESFNDRLKSIIFQEDIGTVFEKTVHTKAIALFLAEELQVNDGVKANVERAASIYKFDLVTQMVNEFPELQGVMGAYYASYFGENDEVAQAIHEQYLPTHASGALPQSVEGNILSVADKLDTIVACISVGLVPTGSQDPYALRRQAIGLLRIIVQNEWNISVQSLLEFACDQYNIKTNDIKEKIELFMKDRGLYILEQANINKDIGSAIVQNKLGKLHDTLEKGKILSDKRHDEAFKSKVEAFIRVLNIGKKHEESNIDVSLFQTDSEKALYAKYEEAKQHVLEAQYDETIILEELEKLAEPIHLFFEKNMVMDKDETIKNNRIALLHQISKLLRSFADFTLIEWKK